MAKKINSKKTAATTSRPTRSSTIPPSDSVLPPTEVTTADDANEQDPGDKKGKRKAWSYYEESKHCIAWINVSQDPEKGTDQNHRSCCKQGCPNATSRAKCSRAALRQDQEDCLLFCGYYEKIEKAPKSGTNEIDWVESAKVKFLQVEGREFVYERSYDVIKHTLKFAELFVPEKGKEPEKER